MNRKVNPPLTELSIRELKARAKELGVPRYSLFNKDELRRAIGLWIVGESSQVQAMVAAKLCPRS